jgi:hypothetical protein
MMLINAIPSPHTLIKSSIHSGNRTLKKQELKPRLGKMAILIEFPLTFATQEI